MMRIESYEIISDRPIETSSSIGWKVKKDNEYFFLKQFNDPCRPSDRLSPQEIKRRNGLCDRFERERKSINQSIKKLGGGNLVAPVDFFLYQGRYYQATPWRDIENKTIDAIVKLSESEKMLILKTAANCVKLLHEQHIIHCDIKPDNIPVTVTKANTLTCSLLDFDAAHLETEIPEPDELFVTMPFMSPELASYKLRRNYYGDRKFNVKSDVFTMGMIFHYYWSGEYFSYPKPARGPYLYNAVLEGVPVTVSTKIPRWLEIILRRMIDRQPENRPSMGEVLEYLKKVDLQSSNANGKAPVMPEKKEEQAQKRPQEQIQRSDDQFIKGARFPDDAISFEVLSNARVLFVYDDGSKMAISLDVAVKKQYISEKSGG